MTIDDGGMMTKKEIEVHEAAALFPMLPDEELQALAEDIATNGLREPIVVTNDNMLLDGRNRLRACEIAGVEPQFRTFDDVDLTCASESEPQFNEWRDARDDHRKRFIFSANIARRHMTTPQRAMATAMLYPEPIDPKVSGARKGKVSGNSDTFGKQGNEANLLSQARFIYKVLPDEARKVIAGSTSLDAAWRLARIESDRQDEVAQAADKHLQKLMELQKVAPDLARFVTEGGADLDEQWKAYEERERVAKEKRIVAFRNVAPIITVAASLQGDSLDFIRVLLDEHGDEFEIVTGRKVTEFDAAMRQLEGMKWTVNGQ